MQCTLGGGVVGSDAFDFITKKVESVRLIGIERVDVNQAATRSELAWVLTECLGVVVEILRQRVDQGFERVVFSAAQFQLSAFKLLPIRARAEQGFGGSDEQARLLVRA